MYRGLLQNGLILFYGVIKWTAQVDVIFLVSGNIKVNRQAVQDVVNVISTLVFRSLRKTITLIIILPKRYKK